MELIHTYFPELSAIQKKQFSQFESLYSEWNERINVISRKDIAHLYERHVLHSLGIAKVIRFKPGTWVMDVGTGGGFPGIPLAVVFPEVHFLLVDSIGKKIHVVKKISEALGLTNIEARQQRAEEAREKVDFVVSRAVTRLAQFYPWVKNKFKKESFNELPNGILYLKGGDLGEEIAEFGKPVKQFPLSAYFKEEFFETKQVIYVQCAK